jgi:tetratricopeptide (TPR) repeat protein
MSQQNVNERIKVKYPGVELESDVQGYAYLQEFESGITCYADMKDPSARDHRWLGVCYFQQIRDMEALEAFYRAIEGGDEGARINLAHLLTFLEHGEDALTELDRVNVETLPTRDAVLYYRVRSLKEEVNGNLRQALAAAELAWRKVQGLPEFPLIAPAILGQLGTLYGRMGRAQRALWFLERGFQMTDGKEHTKLKIRRATVLISLGRYSEANFELESVEASVDSTSFHPEILWLRASSTWSDGHLRLAIEQFEDGVKAAIDHQVGYEEFLCRLSLATIHASQGDTVKAASNMARAQVLISDKSDRLIFRFREILVQYWHNAYTRTHALEELRAISSAFENMGLLQENGLVRLHIANLLHGMNDGAYAEELDSLVALSVTLQNHAFLAQEWTLLREFQEVVAKTHPQISLNTNAQLHVFSTGTEYLSYKGERLKVPLRKGVELLTYFLSNHAVDLSTLLLDIFPDEKPRSAKSYFHQFRHQIKQHVPGLEIEFDPDTRLYRLKSDIDIIWDVAEIRAGKRTGDIGIFLPSSGNEWAQILDSSLDEYRGD